MNKKYWENYYQNELPSDFAKFCLKFLPKNSTLIDIGCGNGRDSYYFGKQRIQTFGIDYAIQPYDNKMVSFKKLSLAKLLKTNCAFDIIYSRFLLHSITNKEIEGLIKWTKNIFIAEFRDITDKPKIYINHKRNLVDGKWVKDLLVKNDFKIFYYRKAKGLARYKNENPVIVRIIAKNVSI